MRAVLVLAACGAPATVAQHPPAQAVASAKSDREVCDHLATAYRALTVETIDPAPSLTRPSCGPEADEWALIEQMAASRDDVHTALLDAGAAANLAALGQGAAARAPGFRAHRAGDGTVVIDASWGAPGVLAGDVLDSIDGAPPPRLVAMPFLLHPDHTFVLGLTRAGASVSVSLAMTAQVQPVPPMQTVRHCAVFARSWLTQDTAAELRAAIATLDPRSVRGIVLDLRGNLGGSDPLPVISLFTGADPVLAAVDLAGVRTPWKRDGDRVDWPEPVAILVDDQTASAAEMIAFALGRLGDARVFGAPTAGALTVPDAIPLDDHVLMVPIARVVDPIDGKPARGDRVTPDVIIEGARAGGDDLQLDRALDWLTRK